MDLNPIVFLRIRWLMVGLMVIIGSSSAIAAPPETDNKFVAQLSLEKLRDTELGQRLVNLTRKMAQEEVGGSEDVVDKITEALGFNPLEEIRSVTLMSTSLERPEDGLCVVIAMGKTTGNIEGLMLTVPGYESEEHGEYTIHSAHQDGKRVYATIFTERNGAKQLLAATSKSRLMELLESAESGSLKAWAGKQHSRDSLFELELEELPEELQREIGDENPVNNIVKLISKFNVRLAEEHQSYTLKVDFTATSEKKAAQIQQLAQGARALVALMEEEYKKDEDFKTLVDILEGVEFEREGTVFSATATVPEQVILEFLKKEADLPL